jgi:1,2-diacylglycerol 3-alpha-glucosyltransferase
MTTKKDRKNILLVWDRMGDYHRARWHALQNLAKGIDVYAADLGRGDQLYNWESTPEEKLYKVFSKKKVGHNDAFHRVYNYIKCIREHKVGYVAIAGYGKISYLLILIFSKLMGRKVLIFAESWYQGNPFTDRLKAWFVRLFCDSVFASGEKARSFFNQHFHYPLKKIVTGYSVVHNDHFANPGTKHTHEPILLCVARFAPEKNLVDLITAFGKSQLPHKGWGLMIVGGGPLQGKLEEMAKGQNIQLKKWVGYDALPQLYHQASCFILPSIFEPWGLVVNEAMAAGLPVIVSNQCGCQPDLVDSSNGWAFDAENPEALISVLDELAGAPQSLLSKMGKQSNMAIRSFTPEIWSQKLLNALNIIPSHY